MTEIAAVILAAGRSSRYRARGGAEASKLVADYRGVPLVRAVADAALGSRARPIFVVTGHARAEVEAALAGLPLTFVDNPDFATGLASSLKTGIGALPPGVGGAIVLLGDMPEIQARVIDSLVDRFAANPDAVAAAPVFAGHRGNPVLLSQSLFAKVARLDGDEGARRLLREADATLVIDVPFDDVAVTLDIDTPDDLAAARNSRARPAR